MDGWHTATGSPLTQVFTVNRQTVSVTVDENDESLSGGIGTITLVAQGVYSKKNYPHYRGGGCTKVSFDED